jgi:O-antigen/teichoic acid export membrane protein
MSVNNFSNLFIAKVTTIKDLGFYTRGTQFADMIFTIFSSVLDSVLLPSLASIQNEREKLIHLTRLTIKFTALIATPILLGLACIAEPLIKFLLTDKWLETVPIMQIICLARLITIISGINVNVLYAIGRTDLALKQQYIKLIIRIVFLVIAIKHGIIFLALAELVSTITHFFINTYYPGKILNYGSLQQIKDISPILFSGLLMSVGIYYTMEFVVDLLLKIVFSTIIGAIIYFSLIYFIKKDEFITLIKNIKNDTISK